MEVQRIAAFTNDGMGGNPAGVVILESFPEPSKMQHFAKEVGYAETAFLHPDNNGWRIRYFAPAMEIPFCGHATIASGAVLGRRFGSGVYNLRLNTSQITVEAILKKTGVWSAALQSPATWSKAADAHYIEEIYEAFGISLDDLDARLPTRLVHAGANHVVVGLNRRARLSQLGYAFDVVRALQAREDLATISFVFAESSTKFHARNPFAIGGLYEDPATGAAAAALAGYLRDIGWTGGRIEIIQGEDMGRKSRLIAEYSDTKGESIRISGEVADIK